MKKVLCLAGYLASLGLAIGLGFGKSASAIETNCAACLAARASGTAVIGGNIAAGFSNLAQIIDNSLVKTSSSPFAGLSSPQMGVVAGAGFGQGFNDLALPAGAFMPSWNADYNLSFDPSFRADYWSAEKAPVFNSSLPWNQFSPNLQTKWAYSNGMASSGLPIRF